tara:strand:+ start:1 stop:942 length:942 start_codon:yes stop_codon:yes gene_type:complete
MRLSGIRKPMGLDDEGNMIPQPGVMMGFGGAPQHGKSTVLLNVCFNMARLNNDISVLYWVLDDSRERTYERLIAMDSGVCWEAVTKRIDPTPEEVQRIEDSAENIEELIATGKIVLKDQTNGRSIPMLQRWVEQSYKEHNRPICVVIDSFHKISSTAGQSNMQESAKAKAHSEELKSLYKTHNLTILASLEVNKAATPGLEPGMINITETRKVEFDFDVVAMVFNHYHDTDGNSDLMIVDGDRVKPIIKVNIRKSKEGGTGPVYFALDTRTFRLNAYSADDIRKLTNTEEEEEAPRKEAKATTASASLEPWNN